MNYPEWKKVFVDKTMTYEDWEKKYKFNKRRTYERHTEEEIHAMVDRAKELSDKYVPEKESKWNGNVEISENFNGKGSIDWNFNINLLDFPTSKSLCNKYLINYLL